MKFKVTGQELSRNTGKVRGPVRDEIIDTDTNVLFKSVNATCHEDRLLAVKRIYEGFWNSLNPNSVGIVFVRQVVPM